MEKLDYVLAAMSAAGENIRLTPVQIQKFFFVLDREVPHQIDGPRFEHAAYDYGPYDRAVYAAMDEQRDRGNVTIDTSGRYRTYSLTAAGYDVGRALADELPGEFSVYAEKLGDWLTSLSFGQLVSAIYERYPEMRANSIFKQ